METCALTDQGQPAALLCLGSRGQQRLAGVGQKPLYARPLPSFGVPTYVEIERIALDLLDLEERGAFSRLVVVSNAPVHRFQYETTTWVLLPPEIDASTWRARRSPIQPPGDTSALITHLLTEHLLVGLYRAVIESSMSEQLARVYAMRMAAESARKVLDELSLAYDAALKHQITQELLEMIAGYDAALEARRTVT